jgi:hypothetical protein
LVLIHAEYCFEDEDDKFPRREIVVEQNHFIKWRSLRLGACLGTRFHQRFVHVERSGSRNPLPGELVLAEPIVPTNIARSLTSSQGETG